MKTLLFVGALVAPLSVLAQSVVVAAVAPASPTVVVTATRTPVEAREALAATTVIDRAEIERSQATDITDILRFEAGIDLGRTGGPGQQTSLFIRGGESNHTLVLIDGIRVNPATSGGAALQNITPNMIERIEIVRGPRSTLYGSDAIGGVINIITRIADKPEASLTVRAGEEKTRDTAIHAGWGDGEKSLTADAQRVITDGIPTCVGTPNRSYDNTSINLGGRTKVGDKAEVAVRHWQAEGNAQYLTFCGGGGPADQDFKNRVTSVDLSYDITRTWTSTITLSNGEDEIVQQQANFSGGHDSVRTRRPMTDWHNVVQAGDANRISFGGAIGREEVDALSFGTLIAEKRQIETVFLQDEVTLGRHHVVAGVNYSDYEGFDGQVNGNLEYGFDLFDATRLIAAAGTGFRAPDATDRFGFGGNPDLDPEKAKNYELGLKQGIGPHQTVDLRAFRSNVKDLIFVDCVASCGGPDFFDDVYQARNIDKYRNRGGELSWDYDDKVWVAHLSGILQKPEDRETGDLLPRRAKRTISGRLARYFGKHYLAIDALGTSKREDVGTSEDAGYALVSLSAGVQILPKLSLQGRVENVLDKDYQTAAGFRQPDSTAYVTVRLDL